MQGGCDSQRGLREQSQAPRLSACWDGSRQRVGQALAHTEALTASGLVLWQRSGRGFEPALVPWQMLAMTAMDVADIPNWKAAITTQNGYI